MPNEKESYSHEERENFTSMSENDESYQSYCLSKADYFEDEIERLYHEIEHLKKDNNSLKNTLFSLINRYPKEFKHFIKFLQGLIDTVCQPIRGNSILTISLRGYPTNKIISKIVTHKSMLYTKYDLE
ncbi:26079_t:CDS:2, partial [Racocetra persica]